MVYLNNHDEQYNAKFNTTMKVKPSLEKLDLTVQGGGTT